MTADLRARMLDLAAGYDTKARTNLDASKGAEADGLEPHGAWFASLGVAYDQMARELRMFAGELPDYRAALARDGAERAASRPLTEQEGGPPNERHPDPTAPELAATRTGTDWCPSCEQEAGTARVHSHGKDFCGTCGGRLVVRPDSGEATR